MSENDFDVPVENYSLEEEEFAYLKIYTDMLTGDSAILLTDGAEIVPGWKKLAGLVDSFPMLIRGYTMKN